MHTHTQQRPDAGDGQQPSSIASRARVVFIAFAIIAAVLLVAEHRVHVLPLLPWLLLAACPLMHVFMHGGHRGHGAMRGDRARADERRAPPQTGGNPP